MPFLGPPDGSRAATDSPTRSGQIHPSSYTGPPMGTTGGETYAAGTNEPTSIPIPPGHVPIITCHSCGARQQIGQYSFLPKTQVISMHAQVGAMNYFALAPPGPGMTAPGPSIAQGQRAGYPPSSGITPPPQQCNVAVHYNSNQGTVQTQPTTTQNGSEVRTIFMYTLYLHSETRFLVSLWSQFKSSHSNC